MEYVNRTDEFEKITTSVRNYDVTYLLAGKAFGLTSFIHELGKRLFQYRFFALNAINGSNIAQLLISNIIQSGDRNNFKNMLEKECGEKSGTLLSAILQGIPYAGPGLAHLIDSKEIPSIYAGNYSSAIEEILLPYLKKYVHTQKVLITVDAAQDMSEESYNLIANLAQIDGVKIILGITDVSNFNYIKLKNNLALYPGVKYNFELFGQPEKKLICELANHLELNFSEDEIKRILNESQNNIHLIVECMLNTATQYKTMFSFSEIDKAIISFLYICYFGLTRVELKQLLKMSNVYCPDIDSSLDNAMIQLEQHRCISQEETINKHTIYCIESRHHPEVEHCISSFSDILYFKNIVYDHYRKPGTEKSQEIIEILYQLSIEFSDHNVKPYALALLKIKLQKGEQISEDIIANANLSKRVNTEIELAVLFYTRERRYSEALKWIESIKGKRNNFRYQTIKGVLLNRVRKFSEAEKLLEDTLKSTCEPRILNTLLAYYTANCIHTKQKEKALTEYYNKEEQLNGTENWGYFLRNLASATPFPEKENLYKEAIDNFSLFNDEYGIYSSRCNLGNALCVTHKASEALPLLKDAEAGLQQFGPNHLHIVYNNLGMCYLMLGNIKNATKYLSLAEKLAYNRMPRLLTNINKACLLLVQNKYEQSINLLDSIVEEVLKHPVSSIRSKYFTNRLLIEYTSSKTTSSFIDYIKDNETYITPYVNESILKQYQALILECNPIDYPSKEWNSMYAPAGLAYWYVDPLKMI